jgi:iron complex transport system substrate-binding protein
LNWIYGLTAILIFAAMATISSEAIDFTLDIYGNANMDDTIDEEDAAFLEAIIGGSEQPTKLSDANLDGKIDASDVEQVKSIIAGTEEAITIIDGVGRNVTIEKPVESVVVFWGATAEVIKSFGEKERIIGVSDDIMEQPRLFPDLTKLPSIGKTKEPDVEKIVKLSPDLVINNEYTNPELIKTLEESGQTIIGSPNHGDPIRCLQANTQLQYVLGATDRSEEYLNWYRDYLQTIEERVAGLPEDEKPTAFYCWKNKDSVLSSSGKDCNTKRLIDFVAARDITADLPGDYIDVDPEFVIKQNPSIIVNEVFRPDAGTEIDDRSQADKRIEAFTNKTAYENIEAVKNDDIYVIYVGILSHNGWIGAVYLAKLFHPDLFQDMDPIAINQEYLTRFQGVDFDVKKEGVLFYPIPESWQ